MDFNAIASSFPISHFHKFDIMSQRDFLLTYGLKERLNRLWHMNSTPEHSEQRRKMSAGAEILIEPTRMGVAYKVFMAVARPTGYNF